MKLILAVLFLLAAPMAAQTIAPAQIKPGSNGQVMTTTGGKTVWGSPTVGGVTSVFGRTGGVTAQSGDYNCSQITSAICELPALYYQYIMAGGVTQTQRPYLNLVPGSDGAVACADDPVTNSTDCTFTGGSSSGITWSINDVTGSRFVNTVYQNTSTNPMFIGGSIGTSGSSTGNIVVAQGPTSGSLPIIDWANQATATVSGGDAGFSATIQPGYYYTVRVTGAVNGGVRHWTEITGTGSGGGGGGASTALTSASSFSVPSAIPIVQTAGTRTVLQSAWTLDNGNGILTFNNGRGVNLASNTAPVLAGSYTPASGGSTPAIVVHNQTAYSVSNGSPWIVQAYSLNGSTPAPIGTPYTLSSAGFGLVYIPKDGATDGSGYLAVAQYAANQIAILNVNASGVITAGATVTGITRANILNDPYDPVSHKLYVLERDQGVIVPVDLTTPLSPVAGTPIPFAVAGGTGLNEFVAAPGDGNLYVALGVEGASSYAQVLTASGTLLGQVAVDHAPQRQVMRGPYTYIAEHDSSEIQIIDNSNPTAPAIASTLNVGCEMEEIAPADASHLYVSGDGGCLVKVNIDNPRSPYVESSVSGANGESALAVLGHYLLGANSTQMTAYDIAGYAADRFDAQSLTAKELQSRYIFGRTIEANKLLVLGSPVCTVANPCSSGTVNAGTANQLAYYAGTGAAVSGLTTGNNQILATNGSGVPAFTGTLPSGVTGTSQTWTQSQHFTATVGAFFGASSQAYITNSGEADFIGLNSAGPVMALGDVTHAGNVGLLGNSTAPSLTSASVNWIGPSSASFTAYGLQLSATAPTGGNQVMLVGAPSSGIAPVTFGQVPNAALVNSSVTVNGTSCTLGSSCSPSGSTTWNSISNPTGSQSLSMGNNASTWTWGSATGSGNLLTLSDTTSNTGTGFLLDIAPAASSSINGGIEVMAAGGSTAAFSVYNNGTVNVGGWQGLATSGSGNFGSYTTDLSMGTHWNGTATASDNFNAVLTEGTGTNPTLTETLSFLTSSTGNTMLNITSPNGTNAGSGISLNAGGRSFQMYKDGGTGNLDINTGVTGAFIAGAEFRTINVNVGTAQSSGNMTITNWGTGAAVSAVSGYSNRFVFTITAGTSPSANPTFAGTFPSSFPVAPICQAQQTGGTGANAYVNSGTPTTTSTGTLTWNGTPVSGSTYIITVTCL